MTGSTIIVTEYDTDNERKTRKLLLTTGLKYIKVSTKDDKTHLLIVGKYGDYIDAVSLVNSDKSYIINRCSKVVELYHIKDVKDIADRNNISLESIFECATRVEELPCCVRQVGDDLFMELPNKKFDVIYADPPWSYRDNGGGDAASHYNTMSAEDIGNLPIRNICHDKTVLFM